MWGSIRSIQILSREGEKQDPRICGEQGGGPGFPFPVPFVPVPNKPYGFCGPKALCMKKKQANTELRKCVNREMGLGSHSLSHSSPSLIMKPYSFLWP